VKTKGTGLVILVFLLLFFMSPLPWTLFFNLTNLKHREVKLYELNSPALIESINTERGEARQAGLDLIGRVFINKFTYLAKDAGQRYLESFDPHFLFSQGDLSIEKSTQTAGPLYWVLLPFLIYGFYLCYKKFPRVFFLVLLLPVLGIFFQEEYETFSRLPFVVGLYFVVALGVVNFFEKKEFLWIKGLVLILLVFEYSRFLHFLILHYPYLIGRY